MTGPGFPTPAPPDWVLSIAERLEEAGFETWAVGGALRDTLLGGVVGDWDLATRARPTEVRRLFRRTVPLGVEHGTVGVLSGDRMVEITTFRLDIRPLGRKAEVEFADSIEDDLARRDFTINAIAWRPRTGDWLDPFGGSDDLQAGVLRTVGQPARRFEEDYLRVLRAFRFAGRFDLEVAPESWEAAVEAVPRLARLSAERIREELTKSLEIARPPSGVLELYREAGVLPLLYPEWEALVGHPDPDGVFPDLWAAALARVDRLARHRPEERLAGLLLDLGVPGESDKAGSAEERGHRRAAALLTRLRFSNARTGRTADWVAAPAWPGPGADDEDRRRWLARVGPEDLPALTRLRIATERARVEAGASSGAAALIEGWQELRRILRTDPPLSVSDLAIDGRDLIRMGLKPGPHFGEILERLLDRVLENPDRNEPEELRAAAAGMADLGEDFSTETSDG